MTPFDRARAKLIKLQQEDVAAWAKLHALLTRAEAATGAEQLSLLSDACDAEYGLTLNCEATGALCQDLGIEEDV